MTHFLRPSRLFRWVRPGKAGGRPVWPLVLAAVWVSGCLPAKTPADTPLTGEPSEVEILRADNAELSRRLNELRTEKAELKRQVALLELKVTSGDAEAPGEGAAASTTASESLAAGRPADEPSESPVASASETSVNESSEPARIAPGSAPAKPVRATPEPTVVLISGSADAADFDRGRDALESGSYLSADQTLTRFLTQNPRHPFADDALVLRGRARVARRQFDAAERDFRQVADLYPDELVAPEAWLELVRLCQVRGDAPGAQQASRVLVARYPDSAAASLVPSELLE